MILAEKTEFMRELDRRGGLGSGRFRKEIAHFVSALALSLDETERRVWRVAQMRGVEVALTDTTPSPVVCGGTWSGRIANLNGMGDVPPFVSEMASAADFVRDAIVTLGGKNVSPRLGKFGALYQEGLDLRDPYRNLCEIADGLDALSEAADDLPERELEMIAVAPSVSETKKNTASAPAARGKRAA
ncbi:MAG TPA: hypothetical protein VMU06_13040 [Stellaceae bacterium]|nr:hypothetical protein [Stellaceae bacterium]